MNKIQHCILEKYNHDVIDLDKQQCVGIDIVFGGDHGQESFKCGISIVIHYSENTKHVQSIQTAQIDVKSDNAAILKKALQDPLNKSFSKMTGGKLHQEMTQMV